VSRRGADHVGTAPLLPRESQDETKLQPSRIIRVTTALLATQAGGASISSAIAQGSQPGADKDADPNGDMPDVTPPEDLMREHGVLNRVLLIYEAAMRKFADDDRFDALIITQAAEIVRDFIEDYHERNEEQQIFPRFRKAGQLLNLVDVLYTADRDHP
jgi:hypothetical protein